MRHIPGIAKRTPYNTQYALSLQHIEFSTVTSTKNETHSYCYTQEMKWFVMSQSAKIITRERRRISDSREFELPGTCKI